MTPEFMNEVNSIIVGVMWAVSFMMGFLAGRL